MGDWSISFPPEIVYYIIVPLVVGSIPGIFALLKRGEVTAVRQYILEELKQDIKELKERVSRLESRL